MHIIRTDFFCRYSTTAVHSHRKRQVVGSNPSIGFLQQIIREEGRLDITEKSQT